MDNRHRLTWHSTDWARIYADFRDDIHRLCWWLEFKPTPQQADLLDAVGAGNLRVACKSGQGPGKTTCSAVVGLWWTMQYEDTLTLITAPSMKQCREIWLAEVRRRLRPAHRLLRKFIQPTKSQVYFGGSRHPNWKCLPITAATPEAFQGFHEDHLNAIVEEASGMASEILVALQGTVSNTRSEYTPDATEGAVLMIGNPTKREGPFFDAFNSQRHEWKTLTFNAEESPIVSRRNIERIAREFGRTSDVYRVRVLGEFPSMDPRGIISVEDLDACTRTKLKVALAAAGGASSKFMGIDYARQGGDETVAYRRLGGAVLEWKFWPKNRDFEPADAVRETFLWQLRAGWSDEECVYVVDASGMGQGVLHLYRDAHKEHFEFHNQGRAREGRIYSDKITEAWFNVARLARDRGMLIPDDPILIQQLSDRHYTIDKDGLVAVESKDDYMKRTEKGSPDRADAFVMAFYGEIAVPGRVAQKQGSGGEVGPGVVQRD